MAACRSCSSATAAATAKAGRSTRRRLDEIGALEDDDAARIGYLQWMMFRLARVVGDTGMHVLRWSRRRTIEQLYELQAKHFVCND